MDKNTVKYIARVCIETESPLKIGSGEQGLNIDQLVSTDFNDLPYMPATSITGVLRHALAGNPELDSLFGIENGSQIAISNAKILDENGQVLDGIHLTKSKFLETIKQMSVRQHVRINHQGGADTENMGKYDEQVICKGVRFLFEIELTATRNEYELWGKLLEGLCSPFFRIGGGTRKGFGKMKVVEISTVTYALNQPQDLQDYLQHTAILNRQPNKKWQVKEVEKGDVEHVIEYQLNLVPDDFMLFSSGDGNADVDMNPVTELCIRWNGNKAIIEEKNLLIPASSIKGAIAHRCAFYYNKIGKKYADNVEDIAAFTGEKNKAVEQIFGCSANEKENINGRRGNLILSDLFIKDYDEEVLNHVSIDRFTGGNMDGALFNEKVSAIKSLELHITLETKNIQDPRAIESLELALIDIRNGMLPLGGGVMRGHGCFSGKLFKNNELL